MTDPIPVRLAAGSGETFGVDDLSCAAATDAANSVATSTRTSDTWGAHGHHRV